MKRNVQQIPISPQLETRVASALGQVQRIHRNALLRRAGGVLGSFVAVLGTLFTLAAVNPALASQIPLVGDWLGTLFFEASEDSKTGTAGTFLETYEVLEEVNVTALTENSRWDLTFVQGYTDGRTVLLSLALDGPQEALDRWDSILVDGYGLRGAAATVNGEQAQVKGVNSFRQKEGKWVSTMEIQVPESQREAETLELSVTLKDLSGRPQGITGGEAIDGEFTGSFSLAVNRDHQFSFVCQAEQNGARVLAVSGGPAETVISVEKPFWGYRNTLVPEDGVKGTPRLVLPDGTLLRDCPRKSKDLGSYDHQAAETQIADLYFDGLPAGVGQVTLEFYDDYMGQETVQAQFVIDLEKQTVSPVE